ncbi:MAG TPA: cytochrome-c oxidase, cbb3-type subunit III [Candidatus Competibacteraceae bacterium]|nr:cytochrome-c oxidase, cbb3-type subunit III [Candidatus Competibacteraceae bacterium]
MNEKTIHPHPEHGHASAAVQTTGHAWDGDLQEFNNPLPRWWLWAFYGTVLFAVIYWIWYPTWPVGSTWTPGLASVTVKVNGEEKRLDWNTRSQLIEDMQSGSAAVRQREYLNKVTAASFEQIQKDPEMLAFARAAGGKLFGDNCAACHGRGGQGVVGLFPNLADDDWLWGGSMERIQETISNGRNGFMPAFRNVLDEQQLNDVAQYVLSLSGEVPTDEAAARGQAIFQGYKGGCYQCHGTDAKGLPSQGSANLTDKIWTLVNVPAQPTPEAKREALKAFIAKGVLNTRQMPAWKDRLSPTEIKLLTVYVHQVGGGQ